MLLLFYNVTFFAIKDEPSVFMGRTGEFMWILMLIATPIIIIVHETRLRLKGESSYKNIIIGNFSIIAMFLIFLVFIYWFLEILSSSF